MKKFDKEIERIADEQIKEHGFIRADLTEEELEELMEEIQDIREHPDAILIDGFWEFGDIEIHKRKTLNMLKDIDHEQDK